MMILLLMWMEDPDLLWFPILLPQESPGLGIVQKRLHGAWQEQIMLLCLALMSIFFFQLMVGQLFLLFLQVMLSTMVLRLLQSLMWELLLQG